MILFCSFDLFLFVEKLSMTLCFIVCSAGKPPGVPRELTKHPHARQLLALLQANGEKEDA